jgi:hypothetical protein
MTQSKRNRKFWTLEQYARFVGKPSGRKEFLYYLKSHMQNVRGATTNYEAVELGDKKPLG